MKRQIIQFVTLASVCLLSGCRTTPPPATPFFSAVIAGDVRLADDMLQKGTDVNELDATRHSPLSYAVMNRDLSMTSLLLRSGANPNGG
jgi:ankyrin repeat protein